MTIDFAFFRWFMNQTDDVVATVAPIVAKLLNVSEDQVKNFVSYIKSVSEAVLNMIELFINYKTVFGATGDDLTDESGCPCPDCPCPNEFAPIVYALKAQAI